MSNNSNVIHITFSSFYLNIGRSLAGDQLSNIRGHVLTMIDIVESYFYLFYIWDFLKAKNDDFIKRYP